MMSNMGRLKYVVLVRYINGQEHLVVRRTLREALNVADFHRGDRSVIEVSLLKVRYKSEQTQRLANEP